RVHLGRAAAPEDRLQPRRPPDRGDGGRRHRLAARTQRRPQGDRAATAALRLAFSGGCAPPPAVQLARDTLETMLIPGTRCMRLFAFLMLALVAPLAQ